MRNFRENLIRFMYGRYGVDQLYYALIAAYFILMIIGVFNRSPIIDALMWAVMIWAFYRSMSRNIYKRRMENEKFLIFWNRAAAKISLPIRRIRERKTHYFHKCPYCGITLRLPRKSGRHKVKCPCCRNEFEVRI